MEKKAKKILRKINIKDYTNSLEKVLEEKKFSIDTKNLLLSMVYKIENSYKDYEKTKVQVLEKAEFLEKLINIIQNKCNEIIVINQPICENKLFDIDRKSGKIIALGNERVLLKSILTIGQENIKLAQEENILKPSINYFLSTANVENKVEVIRDFNGWSWDICGQDIENKLINITFQTLIYLLDYDFIKNWIENNSGLADYLILMENNLEKSFGKSRANQYMQLFCQIVIEEKTKVDKNELEYWQNLKQITQVEFVKLKNKAKYLEELTNEKKNITKEIEKIDKLLNNQELLKNEYEQRNSKLPNKEKIFSVRQLNNKLEVERQEFVEKIKECNKLIEPKEYIKRKTEIEKKYNFLNSVDLTGNGTSENTIIKLCELFLECFKIKILKATVKQDIIKYIYELRYYRFLMLNDNISLKNVQVLNSEFENIITVLYEKARKIGVIEDITKDEKANYAIIRQIFDSKMIDLNNMVIETKIENGKLFIEYYDTNILETRIELYSNKTIKLNKKTKVLN